MPYRTAIVKAYEVAILHTDGSRSSVTFSVSDYVEPLAEARKFANRNYRGDWREVSIRKVYANVGEKVELKVQHHG